MAAKKSTPKAAASKADKQVSAKPAPKVAAKPEKKVASAKKESESAKAAKKPGVVVETPAPAATNGHTNGSVSHSSSFVDKQKQRLLDLRDELVDAMTGTTRDQIRNAPEGSEASGSGMHQGDAGSDAYDRDFALSVLAKEQDALYEIEQALQRIKKGAYGVCEMSGKKIPQARLEAIPFARLTVECQAQWEKEYGNRRFRPSNEVGFSGGNYTDDEDSDSVSLDEDED
jgi:DnaK suppressor protein